MSPRTPTFWKTFILTTVLFPTFLLSWLFVAMSKNWGSGGGESWEERNWDAVRKQEQKKQEILVTASKNSEKVRQMVRKVEETKSIGAETLNELDKQSEQLKRVHGEVDKIENNLNMADRTIRGMESVWGSIRNMWSKGTASSRPQSAVEAARLDRAVEQRKSTMESKAGPALHGSSQRIEPKQVKEYAEDWQGKLKKLEDQQDDDLDQLSRVVKDLKVMSKDMGYTLDAQTKSVEALASRTDAVDARLAKSNLRVKRML